jgi:hypothetical protein
MAESEHDDVADALSRMAEGDVAPAEQPPIIPPRPVAKSAPKPVSTRTAAPLAKPARPAAPVLGMPSPSATPAAPSRAVGPAPSTAVRKQRPTAPTIRQVPSIAPSDVVDVDGGQSTGLIASGESTDVVDDDDSVIVPAPDASAFMPKVKTASSAEVRAAIAMKKNLNFRRTLIPILLTSSTMMLAFGGLKSFSGPDSMFANLAGWIPIVLFSGGGVLLLLAIFNMLSVKAQLDSQRK